VFLPGFDGVGVAGGGSGEGHEREDNYSYQISGH
jgi:hypothetical protein